MKYTLIVDGQIKRGLNQGKMLRIHRVLKQQNVEHMILKEK